MESPVAAVVIVSVVDEIVDDTVDDDTVDDDTVDDDAIDDDEGVVEGCDVEVLSLLIHSPGRH